MALKRLRYFLYYQYLLPSADLLVGHCYEVGGPPGALDDDHGSLVLQGPDHRLQGVGTTLQYQKHHRHVYTWREGELGLVEDLLSKFRKYSFALLGFKVQSKIWKEGVLSDL